jgi:hypothetical protein
LQLANPEPRLRSRFILIILLCIANGGRAADRAHIVLPLHVHVAEVAGQPVVSDEFIESRVTRASEIYAPYGVGFAIARRLPLAAAHAVQDSRDDRDALAAYTTSHAIDCFVVASLRDVDEPERMRRGVHWHARKPRGKHYVILSSIAGPDVLAHELGHFLGNPEHSDVPGNLMSYEHTDVLPFLDAPQREKLRRALAGYLRRRELVPLVPITSP